MRDFGYIVVKIEYECHLKGKKITKGKKNALKIFAVAMEI